MTARHGISRGTAERIGMKWGTASQTPNHTQEAERLYLRYRQNCIDDIARIIQESFTEYQAQIQTRNNRPTPHFPFAHVLLQLRKAETITGLRGQNSIELNIARSETVDQFNLHADAGQFMHQRLRQAADFLKRVRAFEVEHLGANPETAKITAVMDTSDAIEAFIKQYLQPSQGRSNIQDILSLIKRHPSFEKRQKVIGALAKKFVDHYTHTRSPSNFLKHLAQLTQDAPTVVYTAENVQAMF